ncbi:hypothetical protein EV702DRAFT_1047182 [Suillus placidus]|uniref:Uncharacterized protein n=1 Tax=Suillus placidus TaxID=48579 RepID=A0A9P6ZQU7_9AGAM|nr:hypothetical protein EV702DRAFT_1047182 [Suillus placidus]
MRCSGHVSTHVITLHTACVNGKMNYAPVGLDRTGLDIGWMKSVGDGEDWTQVGQEVSSFFIIGFTIRFKSMCDSMLAINILYFMNGKSIADDGQDYGQYFGMESNPSPIAKELHRELGSITRPKKWQKRVTLNYYSHPKSSSMKQRKHTQYQYHRDCSISYTLQYVEPPKNVQLTKHCQPPMHAGLLPAMMSDEFDEFLADTSWGADNDVQSPRKRTMGDNPLLVWFKDRSLFLQEMLQLKG